MKLTLTIESNNDSFWHAKGRTETGYLLRKAAAAIEAGTEGGAILRDINGNSVGSFTFELNSEG